MPGANFPGPGAAINNGNIFGNQAVNINGDPSRGLNDFAGGWSGLSSAAAGAANQYGLSQGMSSAADLAKGWYNREYARDLLNNWPWWSGGGSGSGSSGSDGGYGSSGDSGYSNPYSSDAQGDGSSADAASQQQNGSQATSQADQDDAANADKETAAAKQCMEKAVLAFQKGNYVEAQTQCEQAVRLVPGNADVYQFCALCQFAQGKYKDAAGTLYKVLAAGPGWDWNTLNSFYENAESYTKQLRALEEFVREHGKDAAGRFVLAYHYLVLDERDAAAGQLQEIVKLQPRDKVSAGILKALEKAKKGNVKTPPEKPAPGR
jgi:tetratricopeptide (TPR) repeat protein